MTFECQGCGREFPNLMFDAHDWIEDGHGDELVEHSYPAEDGLGTVTDYYCDPSCLLEAIDD